MAAARQAPEGELLPLRATREARIALAADDVEAAPDMIETLVTAATNTDADVAAFSFARSRLFAAYAVLGIRWFRWLPVGSRF